MLQQVCFFGKYNLTHMLVGIIALSNFPRIQPFPGIVNSGWSSGQTPDIGKPKKYFAQRKNVKPIKISDSATKGIKKKKEENSSACYINCKA